jgi:hypothetical protein
LRDLSALAPCPACGSDEADPLDPTPFDLQPAGVPNAGLLAYLAICPHCGFVRTFTPEVLKPKDAPGLRLGPHRRLERQAAEHVTLNPSRSYLLPENASQVATR